MNRQLLDTLERKLEIASVRRMWWGVIATLVKILSTDWKRAICMGVKNASVIWLELPHLPISAARTSLASALAS
jgi:hypothetical protein